MWWRVTPSILGNLFNVLQSSQIFTTFSTNDLTFSAILTATCMVYVVIRDPDSHVVHLQTPLRSRDAARPDSFCSSSDTWYMHHLGADRYWSVATVRIEGYLSRGVRTLAMLRRDMSALRLPRGGCECITWQPGLPRAYVLRWIWRRICF